MSRTDAAASRRRRGATERRRATPRARRRRAGRAAAKPAAPAAAKPAAAAAQAAGEGGAEHAPKAAPPTGPPDPPPPADKAAAGVHRDAAGGVPGAVTQRQLLGRRLDGHRAGRAAARGRARICATRRTPRSISAPTSRRPTGRRAPSASTSIYCLYSTRHRHRVRVKAQVGGRPAGAVGDGGLAGGELARARGLRHVRRELHRPPRSPADPDARRLAGVTRSARTIRSKGRASC